MSIEAKLKQIEHELVKINYKLDLLSNQHNFGKNYEMHPVILNEVNAKTSWVRNA